MSINFSAVEERETNQNQGHSLHPIISVFGVGGAGNNAINNMIALNLEGVRFIAGNTDMQALESCHAPTKVQLGKTITGGLGAGSHPEVGVRAAEEAEEEIREAIKDSNMLFITAGMGGGTGTGASSIIAKIAKEMDILTVGVVTKPFDFEGRQKSSIAEKGVEELLKYVDTLIVVSNQMLFKLIEPDTSYLDSFKIIDQAMVSCIKSISDLMLSPGVINLDFNDVKFMIGDMGRALFSVAEGEGENRALTVSEQIISNPLIEDVELKGASKVLINIAGSDNITLHEIDDIVNKIKAQLSDDAIINFGTVLDESLGDKIKVSLVATGIELQENKETARDIPSQFVQNYRFENAENGQTKASYDALSEKTEKITRKTRYSNSEAEKPAENTGLHYGTKTVETTKQPVRIKSKKTTLVSQVTNTASPSSKPQARAENKNTRENHQTEEIRKQSENKKPASPYSSRKGFFDNDDGDSLFSRISSKASSDNNSSSKVSGFKKSFGESIDKKLSTRSYKSESVSSNLSKDAFFDLPNFFKIKK